MAETTGISWCDATVNFWHGCKKVSEGCKYCYMYRDKDRWGKDGSEVLKTQPSTINGTLRKLKIRQEERDALGIKEPLKIFTCSYSDFFIDEADHWRKEAWDIIREYREFVWIILTKRPERILECLPEDWGEGWGHVWLLVSAENQVRWNERVPMLLKVPAKVRGVSIEPILEPIYFPRPWGLQNLVYNPEELHWIIIGGESGNDVGPWGYRPAEFVWFTAIVKQCQEANIPVFVKQIGTSLHKKMRLKDRAGADMDEWPEELQIQNFPL